MKKFTLILPVLLLCFVTTWSQKIKYEKSFEEAIRLSHEQNKPLSLLVTMQPPTYVSNFLGILSNPDVVTKFNTNFVNYKVDRSDTSSKAIIRLYNINRFPSLTFLDSKGGIMLTNQIIIPIPQQLLSLADQAIDAIKEKSLIDFDKEYQSGVYNAEFLKDYITKRKIAGIIDNASLIDKYVDFLSVADLDNYSQVLFILKAGPIANSKAHKLAFTNKKIIDSIFKTELYDVRLSIYNMMIANTMASAIATKSIVTANAAANLTRTSWGKDYKQGQKYSSLKMLQYYRAIKDTMTYVSVASYFYDAYYMNISIDSIKKMDQINIEKAKSKAHERAILDLPNGGALQSYSYTYASNNYGNELNNAAWSFYEIGTKNTTDLTKAMLWSKRSIELNPIAAYYDTYAHLLYRLELYAEAENAQQKAVELIKAEKRDVKQAQGELIKIKNKSL
jgi:hypothetical protein